MLRGMGEYASAAQMNARADAELTGVTQRLQSLGIMGAGREDDPRDSQLIQIRKAVEDAESLIEDQLEENKLLRDELKRKERELEKYQKSGATPLRMVPADVYRDAHPQEHFRSHSPNSLVGNEADKIRLDGDVSSQHPRKILVVHHNGGQPTDRSLLQARIEGQQSLENRMNVEIKNISQTGIDSIGPSQFSSPSSRSLSPRRQQKEGEYDQRLNLSKDGLVPISETSSNVLWKQDLVVKVREHEEEISQLKKYLAEYSIKEAQIKNEKYALDKRVAYMRKAFDAQQKDLVDAASKAISYRQEIIEENIRLAYALQAAQEERSTFISSLLPLLSDFNLQPPVLDAQSIVSNLKVLFRHLQEKLIMMEDKVKESQYHFHLWRAETSNDASFRPQSPNPFGAALASSNKNNLEIVPQQVYAHAQSPLSSPSKPHTRADVEALRIQNRQTGLSGGPAKNLDNDVVERNSTSVSRNPMVQEASTQVNQGDAHVRFNFDSRSHDLSFTDLVRGNEAEDADAAGLQLGVNWGPGHVQYVPSQFDDPNSYTHLPPVMEEPSSSFSEAAEDDPLPGIEGLQISGEAFPGSSLLACGYPINGTTTCNFEWVRHLEDGSVNYIEGEKQPNYLVTADDVDCYLAIEVQPLDDRKRKGELFKVFANEQKRIICDPKMQEQIERAFSIGHASFEVSVSASDVWEHASLAIKREGYSIKLYEATSIVVSEKFLPATAVTIPYGQPNEFIIHCASGSEYLLQTADSNLSRDTIVRTLRLFKNRAVEKRKGRKRGLFFK